MTGILSTRFYVLSVNYSIELLFVVTVNPFLGEIFSIRTFFCFIVSSRSTNFVFVQ